MNARRQPSEAQQDRNALPGGGSVVSIASVTAGLGRWCVPAMRSLPNVTHDQSRPETSEVHPPSRLCAACRWQDRRDRAAQNAPSGCPGGQTSSGAQLSWTGAGLRQSRARDRVRGSPDPGKYWTLPGAAWPNGDPYPRSSRWRSRSRRLSGCCCPRSPSPTGPELTMLRSGRW
jgi:hypothetical protein